MEGVVGGVSKTHAQFLSFRNSHRPGRLTHLRAPTDSCTLSTHHPRRHTPSHAHTCVSTPPTLQRGGPPLYAPYLVLGLLTLDLAGDPSEMKGRDSPVSLGRPCRSLSYGAPGDEDTPIMQATHRSRCCSASSCSEAASKQGLHRPPSAVKVLDGPPATPAWDLPSGGSAACSSAVGGFCSVRAQPVLP